MSVNEMWCKWWQQTFTAALKVFNPHSKLGVLAKKKKKKTTTRLQYTQLMLQVVSPNSTQNPTCNDYRSFKIMQPPSLKNNNSKVQTFANQALSQSYMMQLIEGLISCTSCAWDRTHHMSELAKCLSSVMFDFMLEISQKTCYKCCLSQTKKRTQKDSEGTKCWGELREIPCHHKTIMSILQNNKLMGPNYQDILWINTF